MRSKCPTITSTPNLVIFYRFLFFALIFFLFNFYPALADEWFVSPVGSTSNSGTIDSPWDLQTAIGDNTVVTNKNFVVKPGDTIWLRGGKYLGITQLDVSNILTKKLFVSRLSGLQGLPITVRQYPGERATIDGGIEVRGPWTTLWGFEVMNSDTNRTTCPTERPGAINFYARGGKAINMVIHDSGHPGIGFWRPVGDGGELYGNILWSNGIFDTCTSPGTLDKPLIRGSGFYMQNIEGTRYIYDNISFWNFTTGMKAYGMDTDGFDFEGNVVFRNSYENLFVTANGNSTKRLKVISNYSFSEKNEAGGNIGLGIYSPGVYDPGIDVVVKDNYLVQGDIIPWPNAQGEYPAPSLKIANYSDVTVNNNTIVGGMTSEWLILPSWTRKIWDNNTYFSTRIASPNIPFTWADTSSTTIKYYNVFFSDWQKLCNCDLSSTYTSGSPTVNKIFLRPNKYESGRANIIVYNWQNLFNVGVDVSSVLLPGDNYEIRDAQNFYGTPVANGTYSGGSISLPMNLTNVSAPIGNVTKIYTHTSSAFAVFVLLKTGSSVTNYHPADISKDWILDGTEVTSYGSCWKTNCAWQGIAGSIPGEYVTNAGTLWKNGGVYRYDAASTPPWVR